jgi:hypothetical protein
MDQDRGFLRLGLIRLVVTTVITVLTVLDPYAVLHVPDPTTSPNDTTRVTPVTSLDQGSLHCLVRIPDKYYAYASF